MSARNASKPTRCRARSGVGLARGEVDEAGVLGRVDRQRRGARHDGAILRHIGQGAGLRQAFEIGLPAQRPLFELIAQMRRTDGVVDVAGRRRERAVAVLQTGLAVEGVVVVDAEVVAAEQGDIVAFAGMGLAVEPRSVAIGLGQARDIRRDLDAHDLPVVLVLLDDDEDVLIARHAFQRRERPHGRAARQQGQENDRQQRSDDHRRPPLQHPPIASRPAGRAPNPG